MSGFERVDTAANRIRIAMEKEGKRQTDLARETGIDKGSISHYLKGRYEPKQETIYRLAQALNVSEMWLWGYDVPMERPPEQKKMDELSKFIHKIRKDNELFSICKEIANLDKEQIKAVAAVVAAMRK